MSRRIGLQRTDSFQQVAHKVGATGKSDLRPGSFVATPPHCTNHPSTYPNRDHTLSPYTHHGSGYQWIS